MTKLMIATALCSLVIVSGFPGSGPAVASEKGVAPRTGPPAAMATPPVPGAISNPAATLPQSNPQPFRSFTDAATCELINKNVANKENMNGIKLLIGAFITGTNYVKARDSQLDLESMLEMTEVFCRQHPQQTFTDALVDLDRSIDLNLAKRSAGAAAAKPATAAATPVHLCPAPRGRQQGSPFSLEPRQRPRHPRP